MYTLKRERDDGVLPSAKRPAGPAKILVCFGVPDHIFEDEVLAKIGEVARVKEHCMVDKSRNLYVEFDDIPSCEAAMAMLRSHPFSGIILDVGFATRESVTNTKPTKVLLLTISRMTDNDPFDCDRLQQIFDSTGLGSTRKITLWAREGTVRGMVEFDTVEAAQAIRQQLNDATLGEGGPILRLSFSRQTEVLMSGTQQHSKDFVTGRGMGQCPSIAASLQEARSPAPPASSQLPLQQHYAMADPQGILPATWMQTPTPLLAMGTCLVIDNLIPGTSPEAIFRLVGTCADVLAVRVLRQSPSTAMVQCRDAEQCARAVTLLNGCPFYDPDRYLSFQLSAVSFSQGDPHDVTKEYASSLYHRFSGKNAKKNEAVVTSPTEHLLISNIPPNIPEHIIDDQIRLFDETAGIRHFESGKARLVAVQMPSPREAVSALIGLHTVVLPGTITPPGGKGIIVSFSKGPARRSNPDAAPSTPLVLEPTQNGLILPNRR
eukprot:Sspe_Gene.32888::Locus_16102_Transcript_1_1_Confidence_1.000_Length_1577::g.32888::m.32888